MSFQKEIRIEDAMSEAVLGGAALAWRLLATLEGGSLIIATSALLAYTARNKIVKRTHNKLPVRNVLVTNTTNVLGRELRRQLEARGCHVTATDRSEVNGTSRYDALVVVGAEPKADGLEGMSRLVNEDVNFNLKQLESLSPRVRRGGRIAWACVGAEASATGAAYSGAGAAFDTVIQATLQHVANVSQCSPVWVGRSDGAERAAERVVAALVPCDLDSSVPRFSIRNAAFKVGDSIGRWLKIIT